ncbi:hypothetical protein D3C84_834890 [compost metagenome]
MLFNQRQAGEAADDPTTALPSQSTGCVGEVGEDCCRRLRLALAMPMSRQGHQCRLPLHEYLRRYGEADKRLRHPGLKQHIGIGRQGQ